MTSVRRGKPQRPPGLAEPSQLRRSIAPAMIRIDPFRQIRIMAAIKLRREAFHGEWNYEILPRK